MQELSGSHKLRNYFKKFACTSHIVLILCFFGFCIGIFFLFFVDKPNELHWPDSKSYFRAAKQVFDAGIFSDRSISPGFPYFWGAMMFLFGDSILSIKLVLVFMVFWFLYSLYFLGKEAFNKKIGIIFLLLALGYPYFFYIPVALCSESLAILIMPTLLLLMVKVGNYFNLKLLLLLCFLTAFIILLRPTNVIVLMVIPFYWYLIKKWSLRKWLIRCFFLGIIPTIFVFGWMFKNFQLDSKFYFSSGGANVLLETYNSNSITGLKRTVYAPEIQQRLANTSSIIERDQIKKEEALKFIKENKVKAIQIALMNCVNYWNPYPLTYGSVGMAASKYKKFLAIPYILYFILGLLGFLKYWKNPLSQAFVLMFALNTIFNAPLMVSVRYRVIFDFAFILMAAVFLNSIIENRLLLTQSKK
jgi:4-amino-4-deoxy-L-arabinose transferase-like glycosyltransferase